MTTSFIPAHGIPDDDATVAGDGWYPDLSVAEL